MVHFFFLSFLPSFLPFFLAFFVSFCSGSVSHVWKNMSPQQKADHSPELPPLGVFFSKYVGESVLIEYLIRCACILFCLHLPAYAHEGNLCSHPAPANLPARYEWKIVHPIVPKHSNNSLCASKGLLHF